ncbi:MAG: hypothetical protein CMH49_07735, partial [Myxococcales bacterium]|nr:hypothetical protein [Myxococcales bacterium]
MQLYTKILIGMVFGVVIGLCFGPNAALLEHDLYYYSNGKNAPLYLTQDLNKESLNLGAGPLKLFVIKHQEGELSNIEGKPFKVEEPQKAQGKVWAQVEF